MTTNNELQFYVDYDESDGVVKMKNPKTLKRYWELRDMRYHMNIDDLACFYAFNKQQFNDGLNRLKEKGLMSEDEKIYSVFGGLYATKDGYEKWMARHEEIDALIKAECDPQEVYLYEYNNHECMYSYEGDEPAYNIVKHIWGDEIAATLKRI